MKIIKHQTPKEQSGIHKRSARNWLLILAGLGFLLIGLTITNIPIVYSQSSSDMAEGGGDSSSDGGGDSSSDGGGDSSSDGGGDSSSDGGGDSSSDGGGDSSSDGGGDSSSDGGEQAVEKEEICGNGADDDDDGKIDEEDSDCEEQEGKEEICGNGADDDDDGKIDEEDSDCEEQEGKEEICGNGEDDDDDGKIDEEDSDCKAQQEGILQLNMSKLASDKKQEICDNSVDDDDDGNIDEVDSDCKVAQVGILNLSKLPSELSTLPQDEPRATGTFIVQIINDNDNGYSLQPQDFKITIEPSGEGKASPASFSGVGPPGTTVEFSGKGEFGLKTDYLNAYTESRECPAGQIPETFTCTITYDDKYIPPPPPPVCKEEGGIRTCQSSSAVTVKPVVDSNSKPLGTLPDVPEATTLQGPNEDPVTPQGPNEDPVTPQGPNEDPVTPQGPNEDPVTPQGTGTGAGTPQGTGTGAGTPQSTGTGAGTPQSPPLTPQPLATYKSDEKSVSVKYPNDWQITENANNVTFKSPPESSSDRFEEALRVLKVPYKDPLSALTDKIVGDAKANLPSFQIINSSDTVLGGIPANSLVYTYTDNRVGMLQEMVVLTIKDDSAYIIGFIAELPKYNYYLPVIQEMINSIELSDNKSETSSLLPFIPQQPLSP